MDINKPGQLNSVGTGHFPGTNYDIDSLDSKNKQNFVTFDNAIRSV